MGEYDGLDDTDKFNRFRIVTVEAKVIIHISSVEDLEQDEAEQKAVEYVDLKLGACLKDTCFSASKAVVRTFVDGAFVTHRPGVT